MKTTQTDSGGSDTVTDLIITVISVRWPEHSPKTELGHNIYDNILGYFKVQKHVIAII